MPSAVSQAKASLHDDLDNYDLPPDPFGPSPTNSPKNKNSTKRKVKDSDLGLDEEVDVKKRAREPAVKLDEERLLSEAGIPTLRKRAAGLRLKGKGHEFSDASRLLSFYQLWLDDLFPKAKFLDALAMVEKAGHKKRIALARAEWLNENKPKSRAEQEEENDLEVLPPLPTDRQKTPTLNNGVPNEEDLYGSTPQAKGPVTGRLVFRNDYPDEDDLDAIMAEAAAQDSSNAPISALFENLDDNEEDDLDALIAETERDTGKSVAVKPSNAKSVATQDPAEDEFAAEEEAMREMLGFD